MMVQEIKAVFRIIATTSKIRVDGSNDLFLPPERKQRTEIDEDDGVSNGVNKQKRLSELSPTY